MYVFDGEGLEAVEPMPRHGLGVVLLDDDVYVVSGGPETGL